MPHKPLRPCRKIGCRNLTREGYCEEHASIAVEEKAERNRYYDRHVRDKQADGFYQSREWEALRSYVLSMHNGLDLYAYYIDKKIEYATTGHHIEELKEAWSKRLNVDNIFPCNESNHNRIHAMYKKDKKGTQRLLRELLQRWKDDMRG